MEAATTVNAGEPGIEALSTLPFLIRNFPCYLLSLVFAVAVLLAGIIVRDVHLPGRIVPVDHVHIVFNSIWFSLGASIPILSTFWIAHNGLDTPPTNVDVLNNNIDSYRTLQRLSVLEKRAYIYCALGGTVSLCLFLPDFLLYTIHPNNVPLFTAASTAQFIILSLYLLFTECIDSGNYRQPRHLNNNGGFLSFLYSLISTANSEFMRNQLTALLIAISACMRYVVGLFPQSVGPAGIAVYAGTTLVLLSLVGRAIMVSKPTGRNNNYAQRLLSLCMLFAITMASNVIFLSSVPFVVDGSSSNWDGSHANEFAAYVYVVAAFKVLLALQADFRVRFKTSTVQAATFLNKQYVQFIADELREPIQYQTHLSHFARELSNGNIYGHNFRANVSTDSSTSGDNGAAKQFHSKDVYDSCITEIQSISQAIVSFVDRNCRLTYNVAPVTGFHIGMGYGLALSTTDIVFEDLSAMMCFTLSSAMSATLVDFIIEGVINPVKYKLDIEIAPGMDFIPEMIFNDPMLCIDTAKFREALYMLTQILDQQFEAPGFVSDGVFIKMCFIPLTEEQSAGEFLQGVSRYFARYLALAKSRLELSESGVVTLYVGRVGYSVAKPEFEYTAYAGRKRPIASKYLIAKALIERMSGKLEIDTLITSEGETVEVFAIKLLYFERSNRARVPAARQSIAATYANVEDTSMIHQAKPEGNPTISLAAAGSRVTPVRVSTPKVNILIVDDVKSSRKVLRRMLESLGHECTEAANGEEAQLIMCGPDANRKFSCIFIDFVMPVIDGPTLTMHLRNQGYRGYIVGFSGISNTDKSYFLECGANKVLDKPITWSSCSDIVADIKAYKKTFMKPIMVGPEIHVPGMARGRRDSLRESNSSVDVGASSWEPSDVVKRDRAISPPSTTSSAGGAGGGSYTRLPTVDELREVDGTKPVARSNEAEVVDIGSEIEGEGDDYFDEEDEEKANHVTTRYLRSENGLFTVEGLPSFMKFVKNSLHVLVVDDVFSNRRIIGQILERYGHTFEEAIDGVHAIEKVSGKRSGSYDDFDRTCELRRMTYLKKRSDSATSSESDQQTAASAKTKVVKMNKEFDAVFLDHIMPKMDGPTCCFKLRTEVGFKNPIIGVTGNVVYSDVAYFKSMGLNALVEKPMSIDTLNNVLREHCGR